MKAKVIGVIASIATVGAMSGAENNLITRKVAFL
jgi:hypothetical protein